MAESYNYDREPTKKADRAALLESPDYQGA